jgi:FG-GAP-like repeat/ASPIC and UnbV
MTLKVRFTSAGLFCLCIAVTALVISLVNLALDPNERARQPIPILPTPRDPKEVLDQDPIEDGGFGIANQFMPPIHDPSSLRELREAIQARGLLGLAVLQAESEQIRLRFRAPKEEVAAAAQLLYQISLLNLYEGRYSDAATSLQDSLKLGRPSDIPRRDRARRMALLGIIALRQGEVDNGLGASSGIFPIARQAVHTQQSGARDAVKRFTAYLQEWPEDLRIRWLLNIAFMTLGKYPDSVPVEYLVPLDTFRSTVDVGRFENVAQRVGLNSRGVNLAGGSVFDDFNGDGLPDLFVTSLDVDRGAAFFVNRGDGTFVDRSAGAGLGDQVYAVNLTHADFDNDGDLDVVLLRGAGEGPMRLSLLRNNGDESFEDVTIAGGLGEPIATGAAAWGDYDNDGWVDLFVCGEHQPPSGESHSGRPDPRNRCRLYHNKGDGTFRDDAVVAGVINERFATGAAWSDYDDDGWLDLYISNADGMGRLFHNEGDGTFRDVALALDVTGPEKGHACWFWDFDNDGRSDLFVSDDQTRLADTVAIALGQPVEKASHARLYHNLGAEGFREVSREVGLDRPTPSLGCNFGDIDNDGYLDMYVGTGWRGYSGLVPNRMLKNVEGRRFEDVTMSSGTGHLQNGQGVSFADWDCDGDLDLFVETGGTVPGNRSHNLLFLNPGHDNHWLKVRLVGTRTNRAALGAKIRVETESKVGRKHSIVRTVGQNSSFGGNSLLQSIGLHDATRVAELTITWPTSRTTQTFRDIESDQAIEITEGAASYHVFRQQLGPTPAR